MKRYSIVTDNLKNCYICGRSDIHIHEMVHGTANRKLSIKYGLVIPLCVAHHYEVHNSNSELDKKLKVKAQEHFERVYTELDFRKIFGKSYKEL